MKPKPSSTMSRMPVRSRGRRARSGAGGSARPGRPCVRWRAASSSRSRPTARSSVTLISRRSEMSRSFRSRAASISCFSSNSRDGGAGGAWGRRRGVDGYGIAGRDRVGAWVGSSLRKSRPPSGGSRGIAPLRRPVWESGCMEHGPTRRRVNGFAESAGAHRRLARVAVPEDDGSRERQGSPTRSASERLIACSVAWRRDATARPRGRARRGWGADLRDRSTPRTRPTTWPLFARCCSHGPDRVLRGCRDGPDARPARGPPGRSRPTFAVAPVLDPAMLKAGAPRPCHCVPAPTRRPRPTGLARRRDVREALPGFLARAGPRPRDPRPRCPRSR